ncbi:MAG: hypothetical protein R3F29_03455 [Planctomycetota bacterium]
MKLILSRKGFDSAAGGVASPILPDGTLMSLPIPDRSSPIRYSDIELSGHSLGGVVESLTRGKKKAHFGAHLDPDLVAEAVPRLEGWRPVFGQAGGEQSVLEREGVGPGDLFLFFGWFREVELGAGAWRYRRGAEDLHVLWGWMQIGEVMSVERDRLPDWVAYHPHVAAKEGRSNNTLYVAADVLDLGDGGGRRPGAGTFGRYDVRRRLTAVGASRSVWELPAWFEPVEGRRPLGYHASVERWERVGEAVRLRTVGRGQEFVLDACEYPEAVGWVRGLW